MSEIINPISEDGEEDIREYIEINNKARTTIYICLIFVSTFSSCDGGIIPQQTQNIKTNFGKGDSLVGFFGSVDYIGRVIGAIIFAIIMGKMNRKILLVLTLIFKALTLFVPLFTDNPFINIISRGLSGISQVFYTTYLPVWCDQYGKSSKKALMVTFVQLGNPFGVIIGYGIGMIVHIIMNSENNLMEWRICFGIEGIILVICAFIIFFFKRKYFSQNFVLIDDNKGYEKINNKKKTDSIISNFGIILCNKLFLFTTLSNSVAFFGMSVVQYWGENYMEKVLKMDTTPRFIAFGSLCLLGPILGMVFGGYICSRLGGYDKRSSMIFIIILSLSSSIISCIIAHTNTVFFIITCWSYLFLICASIPPESGIIISSLSSRLSGDGFALSNSILNLFGSFPASSVFSILSDLFEKKLEQEKIEKYEQYRYAWMISMGYNFIGLLFIIIAGIFRFKIKGDLSKDEMNENDFEINEES